MRSPNPKPLESKRPTLVGFAQFLHRYVRAWPVLIACVIGPINKYLHLIPMYEAHENVVTSVVSVYGFLFAAAVFHYQPTLFRRAAVRKMLPLVLILVSVISLFLYTTLIQNSIRKKTDLARRLGVESSQLSPVEIMARTGFPNIPYGTSLLTLYLIGFFGAETGLITLALLEYVKARSRSRSNAPVAKAKY
jgi:hypothetical protein